MKKLLLLLVAGTVCFGGRAESLTVDNVILGERSFTGDVVQIYTNDIDFYAESSEACNTAAGATAVITCDGKVVRTVELAPLTDNTVCFVRLKDAGNIIEKGKEYCLTIPAGSYVSVANPEVVNEEINVPFKVADSLNQFLTATYPVEADTDIELINYIMFKFNIPVYIVGSAAWELYRGEELIDKYAVQPTEWYDPHFGYFDSYVVHEFYNSLALNDGALYTLTLPAGSLCAPREDITNDEIRINFTAYKDESGIINVVAPAAAAPAYDLQGRRVSAPTRGLYIINGKKQLLP